VQNRWEASKKNATVTYHPFRCLRAFYWLY